MITKIESKGLYIDECRLPGESKADQRVPAQHNTVQLSRDRWFVVYETRGFRGVDDNCSAVYQVRRDRPDGEVLKEGYLDRSTDDWEPFGDGVRYVKNCNHSTVFGLPQGAVINGKTPPHAGVFAVAWMNHARYMDPEDGYLLHSAEHELAKRSASRAYWTQFKLNKSGDDIDILQARIPLCEAGYEGAEAICSHESLRAMNQSFVNPVPYNEDASEWVYMRHWGGVGGCTAVRYQWNPATGLYQWKETGPMLTGIEGHGIGEAAIAPWRNGWVIVARIGQSKLGERIYGNVWYHTENPLDDSPNPILSRATGSNCPITCYTFPDGAVRVLTTNQEKSTYQQIFRRRIPLHIMDIDPGGGYAVTKMEAVFDSLKEGLPIPEKHAPTIHFSRLIPHTGGNRGTLTYVVRTRAISTRTHTIGNYKGIVQPEEIQASGVYYSDITYDRDYPPMWEFATNGNDR